MSCLKLRNESGAVIVIVLLTSVLGTILIGSFINTIISESRNSVWQKHRIQSLFIAEAGVEKGLYFLNRPENRPSGWQEDENGILITPVYYEGELRDGTTVKGKYKFSIHSPIEEPWLPERTYLIRSEGIIPRYSGNDIDHRISIVAGNLGALPIPAAVSIFDSGDPEIELSKFDSSRWTVDGKDNFDNIGGLPGIAIANADDIPTLESQLGARINSVTGAEDDPLNPGQYIYTQGANAILKDPSLPKNLDAYAEYFKNIAIDISGIGSIPTSLLGNSSEYQVLYADLSKGNIKLAGTTKGYGVIILEGNGQFELAGGSEWRGVVICAGNSNTVLAGGGNTPAHIYGALLVANGIAEMNGTADVKYNSDIVGKVNARLLLYQVYSWCDGWGEIL